MKLGCVVQGNIRVPLKPVIDELSRHFDCVVVSTWEEDRERCPPGNYELVVSQPPAVRGVTNRNLQRHSTARGLEALSSAGCTHVLKWRTDMLPTRLDVKALLDLCSHNEDNVLGGRIVTGAFRHLSVVPDWFSSFPDLYAFSTLRGIELLWSDEGFNYELPYNIPQKMQEESRITVSSTEPKFVLDNKTHDPSGIYAYDAHTELYAIFKDRIQKLLSRTMSHAEIVGNYFKLIDDYMLGICWFSGAGALPFRAIRQGVHIDWWRPGGTSPPRIYSFEEMQHPAGQNFPGRALQAASVYRQKIDQAVIYGRFRLRQLK